MSTAMIEKLRLYRALQAQYEAFITQQHFVTDPGRRVATPARLAAIDRGLFLGAGVHQDESQAFGGMDRFTTPSWPGVPPSPDAWPAAGAVRSSEAGARAGEGHWCYATAWPTMQGRVACLHHPNASSVRLAHATACGPLRLDETRGGRSGSVRRYVVPKTRGGSPRAVCPTVPAPPRPPTGEGPSL